MTTPRASSTIISLSKLASFSVANAIDDAHKNITLYYDDPHKQNQNLMVVVAPGIEYSMDYDEAEKRWFVEVQVTNNARDYFEIRATSLEEPIEQRMQSPILYQDYIALTDGKPHPWIYENKNTPKGILQKKLYSADGSLSDPIAENKLQPGDRLITIYLPPDYNPSRIPPYNLQITLDGNQYLEAMRMNVAFDNLIAAQEIEPTVIVFIPPYSGAPNSKEVGFGSVCPPGYSLQQRFKEYSCNFDVADRLAAIPALMRKHNINVTTTPEHTTLWGFSMSALQAAYTALLHPFVFGNVVAQSMMAFNIPIQNGDNWREKITSDWTSSTAILPDKETHDEYITQMLVHGYDDISHRSLSARPLNFYFTAGIDEEKYEPAVGTANLVVATDLFAASLKEKGHHVVAHQTNQGERLVLVVSPGGHTPITCRESAPTAIKTMHPPLLSKSAELTFLELQAAYRAQERVQPQSAITKDIAAGAPTDSSPTLIDNQSTVKPKR